MIISNLTGGLGNQLFQYSFGRSLAIKNNTELKLHFTNALFNTQYEYELGHFNIQAAIATDEKLQRLHIFKNRIVNRAFYLLDDRLGIQFNNHIATQRYPYPFNSDYRTIPNNTYVQGYWADERYFKENESMIRKELTPKKKLDTRNQKIVQEMKRGQSVSIHVRRGDFVTNKLNIPQFIGLKYYIDAVRKIKKITSSPQFYIFSNDMRWCRENITPLIGNGTFIEHNTGKNSYKDLLLMSACHHNIIANSTFSWWGAWLNENKNKTVISPHKT